MVKCQILQECFLQNFTAKISKYGTFKFKDFTRTFKDFSRTLWTVITIRKKLKWNHKLRINDVTVITITQQMHFDWSLDHPCSPCTRVTGAQWPDARPGRRKRIALQAFYARPTHMGVWYALEKWRACARATRPARARARARLVHTELKFFTYDYHVKINMYAKNVCTTDVYDLPESYFSKHEFFKMHIHSISFTPTCAQEMSCKTWPPVSN